MNKGNPRVIFRVEQRLLDLIGLELERANARRRGQPFDRSAWMRQAIIDKLKHGARSRGGSIEELRDLDVFPETGT
jgi:hypothetical protein